MATHAHVARRRGGLATVGSTRTIPRSILATLALVLGLLLLLVPTRASAWTQFVDGNADQLMQYWAEPFAAEFHASWVGVPATRIKYSRFVGQWNAIKEAKEGNPTKLNEMEGWLTRAHAMGLVPVLGLVSYSGVYPSTSIQYGEELKELLKRAQELGAPIAYVEAWNEPNNGGRMTSKTGTQTPAAAAHFWNEAYRLCHPEFSCEAIAGDFEDTPAAEIEPYVAEYKAGLSHSLPTPVNWGMHPYRAVRYEEEVGKSGLKVLRSLLPSEAQIWFTEVGAYFCKPKAKGLTAATQAASASYLVNTLMADPSLAPAHVFYYEFKAAGTEVSCAEETDTELYTAAGAPRPAADVISEGPAPQSNSRAAVRDLTSGDQWQYHVGKDLQIWSDSWNGKAWSESRLPAGSNAAANATPAVLRDPLTGDQWVYYIGANGHLWSDSWNGSTWVNTQITGAVAAANASPTAMRDAATGDQWVYYVTSTGRIESESWSGEWTPKELPATVQPAAANASPVAIRDVTSGEQWIYFVGAAGEIEYEAWPGAVAKAAWKPGQLSVAVTAAASSSPSAMRDAGTGDQWVYYIGSNGRIESLSYSAPTNTWTPVQLPAGVQAAASTSLSAIRDVATGDQWVYYAGTNGQLEGESYNALQLPTPEWAPSELSPALPAAGKSAAGWSPEVIRDAQSGDQWIYYTGANKREWSDSFDVTTSSWTHAQLPAGSQVAASTSPAVVRDAPTGDQWLYFVGEDHHIWSESWNTPTSEWATSQLPAAPQPPAAGTSPAALQDEGTADQWVYYAGANGQIESESWGGTASPKWTPSEVLPANVHAAASGASPAVMRDGSSGDQWVYYIGADGRVQSQSFNAPTSKWSASELPAGEGTAAAATPAVVRNSSTGDQWVYYESTTGRLEVEHYHASTEHWENTALSATGLGAPGAGPVIAAEGSNLRVFYLGASGSVLEAFEGASQTLPGEHAAANASPAATLDGVGDRFAYYVDATGQIESDSYLASSKTWTASLLPAGEQAAGNASLALTAVTGGDQWLYYVGADGQMWQESWDGTKWSAGSVVPLIE